MPTQINPGDDAAILGCGGGGSPCLSDANQIIGGGGNVARRNVTGAKQVKKIARDAGGSGGKSAKKERRRSVTRMSSG